MDGENNGKPYEQMDDLGGIWKTHPYFWVDTHFSVPGTNHLVRCRGTIKVWPTEADIHHCGQNLPRENNPTLKLGPEKKHKTK